MNLQNIQDMLQSVADTLIGMAKPKIMGFINERIADLRRAEFMLDKGQIQDLVHCIAEGRINDALSSATFGIAQEQKVMQIIDERVQDVKSDMEAFKNGLIDSDEVSRIVDDAIDECDFVKESSLETEVSAALDQSLKFIDWKDHITAGDMEDDIIDIIENTLRERGREHVEAHVRDIIEGVRLTLKSED